MSGSLKEELKSTKKEFSRNPVSKKADQVFGTVLHLRSAVNAAESGKGSKQEKREFSINVSDEAEKVLGSLRKDLASSCAAVGVPSPLLDQCQISLDIEITTGAAIWQLIDENKFWERAQNEAMAACRDRVASQYLERIRKSGVELRGQLNQYANLAHALNTTLPQDVRDSLKADVEQFVKTADGYVVSMRQRIANDAAEDALTFIKTQLKLEKDIIKYRTGKTAIVVIDSGLIAGHVAHMAASFGATAPLAIIAVVRLVVEIAQIAEKALRDLEGLAKRINAELDLVVDYWSDPKNKGGFMAKLKANTMETLSGLLAGVTNIEFPSVDAVKTLMNDYRHKLNVLTKSFNDLGTELARLQRIMEAYSGILNESSKRMTREQNEKVNIIIDDAEEVYKALYKTAMGGDGKSERIKQGEKNLETWQGALDKVEEVTSKYTKWVSKGAKIVTSAGLGLGNLGGELAHLVGQHVEDAELVHHAAEIASVKLKMMGEAVTVVVADAGLANLFEQLAKVKG